MDRRENNGSSKEGEFIERRNGATTPLDTASKGLARTV